MILHPSFVLPVMPGETPVSYASRLALGIGCSLIAFCTRTDIPLQELYDGVPRTIALLCEVCQFPHDTFAGSTFMMASGRRLMLAGQMLSTDQVTREALRICPICVEEQLADGRDFHEISSPMEWSITPLHVCDKHSIPMLTVAQRAAHPPADFALRLRDAWREGRTRTASVQNVCESGLGNYIRSLIYGVDVEHWLLPRMPLYAAIKTTFMVGSIARHGVHQVVGELSHADRFETGRIGYEILKEGESGLSRVFSQCQRNTHAEASTAGLKSTFGRLYVAMSQGRDASYDPLRDVLRRHIVGTMPFGPGDVVLGQEVTERRVHSARTVATELGVSIPTSYRRLRLIGVLDENSEELVPGQSTFDAAAHARDVRRLAGALQRMDAGRYMGLNKKSDGLTPVLDAIGSLNIDKTRALDQIFAKEDLDAFVVSVLSKASSGPTPPDFEPIAKIAKRTRTSLADILVMISRREITELYLSSSGKGMMSVMVRKGDVLRAAVARRPWVSLTAGARVLKIRSTLLTALVRDRVIPSAGISPVMIRRDDLEAFKETYVSWREVTRAYRKMRGPNRRFSVTQAMADARLAPVFDEAKTGSRIYRRDEVFAALGPPPA